MSTTPIKSAKVRTAVKAAVGAAAVATPLLFAAGPASADVQVGDTTVDIGGFVRADFYYDFDDAAGQAPSLLPLPSMVNRDNGDTDGQFSGSTVNTRVTLSINTPTSIGDVGGYIEGDFFSGNRTFRLRQAYVTYQNFLIGKTWTTFFNPYFGPTVDFGANAGGGMNFGRNKQIRYTIDFGGGSNFAVALEASQNPIGSSSGAVLESADSSNQILPTLVMRYQGSAGMFSYQVAGMVRQLEAQRLAGDAGTEDSVTSWAVNAGGALALSTGTTFKLMGAYGEATGNYIFGGLGFGGTVRPGYAAYFDGNDLEATESWEATATVVQKFTDTLSASVMYSIVNDTQDDSAGGGEFKGTGQQAGVGLFYSPVAPLTFGLGFKHVEFEYDAPGNAADWDGDANRITFATTYSF